MGFQGLYAYAIKTGIHFHEEHKTAAGTDGMKYSGTKLFVKLGWFCFRFPIYMLIVRTSEASSDVLP